MRSRKLSSDKLWERHESIYTELFTLALKELASRKQIVGDEDAISESLNPIFTKICLRMNKAGKGEIRTPDWEKPKQPVVEDDLRGGDQKKPDFTCSLINSDATTPEEYEVPFHIECKLLGKPTSPSWNLCKNYTSNGIMRFDNSTHQYGKRAKSGMMIGYLISMTPAEIQNQVNNHKKRIMDNVPDVVFCWAEDKVVWKTQNPFTRRHVEPSNFKLIHIWVDLTHNYKK